MSTQPRGITESRDGRRVTWSVRRGWTEVTAALVMLSFCGLLVALLGALPGRWGSPPSPHWRRNSATMGLVTGAAMGLGLVLARRRTEILLDGRALTSRGVPGWMPMSRTLRMTSVRDVTCSCTTRDLGGVEGMRRLLVTMARVHVHSLEWPYSAQILVTDDAAGAAWISEAIRRELGDFDV